MGFKQLIINPGSTSTKLALYEGKEKVVQESVEHDAAQMQQFRGIADQIPFRTEIVQAFMEKNRIQAGELSAVVARGGLLPGLKTGGYLVNDDLCRALVDNRLSQPHPSNLAALLARNIAAPLGIPAYIYDAVTSSELPLVARITGTTDILRQSYCHALNSRAMAIRYAESQGVPYAQLRLIVVHMGGGISLSAHIDGKIVDSIGDDEGPFSPERGGSLPAFELVRMCYSGKYTMEEMQKKLRGTGGMYAHLGTSDCRVIEERIQNGDAQTELIFQAQAYQIAKGIGELSAALRGRCDAVILTGGLAYSKMLTELICGYLWFIGPVVVLPGENEMEALAYGGLRILSGEETAQIYSIPQSESACSHASPGPQVHLEKDGLI